MCIFFSVLNRSLANQKNLIMNGWKYRSKGLLKAVFFHQKSNKKALYNFFFQPPVPLCRGAYIPSFKINAPIFCCPLLSGNYFHSQVRISKMVKKHAIDYHPSPSQLTSRIQPPIFLWNPKGFISLDLSWIFS